MWPLLGLVGKALGGTAGSNVMKALTLLPVARGVGSAIGNIGAVRNKKQPSKESLGKSILQAYMMNKALSREERREAMREEKLAPSQALIDKALRSPEGVSADLTGNADLSVSTAKDDKDTSDARLKSLIGASDKEIRAFAHSLGSKYHMKNDTKNESQALDDSELVNLFRQWQEENPETAAKKTLKNVKGVGEKTAEAIVEAKPDEVVEKIAEAPTSESKDVIVRPSSTGVMVDGPESAQEPGTDFFPEAEDAEWSYVDDPGTSLVVSGGRGLTSNPPPSNPPPSNPPPSNPPPSNPPPSNPPPSNPPPSNPPPPNNTLDIGDQIGKINTRATLLHLLGGALSVLGGAGAVTRNTVNQSAVADKAGQLTSGLAAMGQQTALAKLVNQAESRYEQDLAKKIRQIKKRGVQQYREVALPNGRIQRVPIPKTVTLPNGTVRTIAQFASPNQMENAIIAAQRYATRRIRGAQLLAGLPGHSLRSTTKAMGY